MKLQIKVDDAIAALKANLDEHILELRDAVKEWTRLTLLALEKYRDAVDRTGLKASHDELSNLFHNRPQDTRQQYSKYLSALEKARSAAATTVEVDEDDCDRIFNDNWDWRVYSKTANAAYSSRN